MRCDDSQTVRLHRNAVSQEEAELLAAANSAAPTASATGPIPNGVSANGTTANGAPATAPGKAGKPLANGVATATKGAAAKGTAAAAKSRPADSTAQPNAVPDPATRLTQVPFTSALCPDLCSYDSQKGVTGVRCKHFL